MLGWACAALPAWNLAGPLPVRLTIDNQQQRVGQSLIYRITGAPPGAAIAWSSFKNGEPTGERNAIYSDVIEANGTAEIKGDPWKADHVGRWIKQIDLQGADGATFQGIVEFVVLPEQTPQPANPIYAPPSGGGSFLSQELFTLGDYSVTPGTLLAVGVGLYALKALRIIK